MRIEESLKAKDNNSIDFENAIFKGKKVKAKKKCIIA